MLYAEIPGASHAFEIFHSVRTANVVIGVERFLAWLYSAYQARQPEAPAEPVARSRADTDDRRRSGRSRTRSDRSDDHSAYGAMVRAAKVEQHRVVVDPPAGEVEPCLVAVGLQRDARRGELAQASSNSSRAMLIGSVGAGSGS